MNAQAIEVKVNSKALLKALNACPDELYKALKVAGYDIGKRYLGYHRVRRMRGPADGNRGVYGPVIAKHFFVDTSGTELNTLRMAVGSKSRVVLEHELGAILKPRSRVHMAIPYGFTRPTKAWRTKARALLRRGRHQARAAKAGFTLYEKGRKQTGLIPITNKAGKIFLVTPRAAAKKSARQAKGAGYSLVQRARDKFVVWFHLVKTAHLKPRLDFRALWKPYRLSTGMKRFNAAVKGAIAAARRKGVQG